MDLFWPLQWLADLVTYQGLGFGTESYLGKAVHFFVYDSLKIGLLLIVINYLMAMVRSYFPLEKVRAILTTRRWYGLDYLLAAGLGVVTPFCSCSSIPLFMGFVGAGIPLGVTFTFLISSPLVNEASLYLFPALFGLKVTLWYNLIGMAISILGGLVISRLKVERYVQPEVLGLTIGQGVETETGEKIPLSARLRYWWQDGMVITKRILPYVLLGVGLGALIHGFVPAELVESYLATRAWYSIPLATILGVPLYANSVGVIPVLEVLVDKGVPLGTALAFMTAVVTVSIPEAMMLKTVMRWQLLAIFFGITILGINLMGYIFNWLL